MPHPAAIFGGWGHDAACTYKLKPPPQSCLNYGVALDTIICDAHPSKSAKGEAAEFCGSAPATIKVGQPPNYLKDMKCFAVVLLSVIFCAPSSSIAADRPRKTPCKTEANAKSCYWAHGRLSLHMGSPSFRLWKIGTPRMLAIYSGPSVDFGEDNEHPEFPANIQHVFRPSKNSIFADFEVCPLEPAKPGVMQAACIESAKNIFVENYDN
jgi:hypothetical protein